MIETKQVLWLLFWTVLACGLRFANLDSKPPWTDEFSTLVFSLGNSFQGVPVDRPIALETLLEPLKFRPNSGVKEVFQHLLTESNHPPVYFAIAHGWMQLFGREGYVSLWAARALPALFGVASVPAIYGLGRLAFRSRLVGLCAAAMMAVSPYAIYLAQEARHYTLGILLVIASLSCLVIASRSVQRWNFLPLGVSLIWIFLNSLGMAVHYFFSLTLGAEALVLMSLFLLKLKTQKFKYQIFFYLLIPVLGTLAGGLVWLPIFSSNQYGSELTEWIVSEEPGGFAWISPIFQALAGWITMLSLLPVESSSLPVVIMSGLGMILFFLWALPILFDGLKIGYLQRETRLEISILGGFVLSAIALFFSIRYCLGIDLTRGARYNFVYFPAVIVLVGASLAMTLNLSVVRFDFFKLFCLKMASRKAVAIILIMGLLSGVTVVSNLGYQKYYKPEHLVSIIRETSQVPVLIATLHKTHVQVGELMGIGWEWLAADLRHKLLDKPEELREKSEQLSVVTAAAPMNYQSLDRISSHRLMFLLAHQQDERLEEVEMRLKKTLSQLQYPLDLWLVNFDGKVKFAAERCQLDSRSFPNVDGYDYQLYHCDTKKQETRNRVSRKNYWVLN